MGDIIVHIVNMPDGFRGHVNPNCDGSYSIFINAKLTYEEQLKTYEHELWHIFNNDFEKDNVDNIEMEAHQKG